MTPKTSSFDDQVQALYHRLQRIGERGGYHLNPNLDFTLPLVEGLLKNEARYGYQACPCRLATGDKGRDLDIICPCDYRDADLLDYGTCYCGLYVSQEVLNGLRQVHPITERRNLKPEPAPEQMVAATRGVPPVWRCRVCGYLCSRDKPPAICPICGAKQDRFELYPLGTVSQA